MDKVRVESFDLKGVKIKTTVIDIPNSKAIDEHISSLLHSASENRTKVIGFDIQYYLIGDTYSKYRRNCYESRCANLNFCVGQSCLIIRLKCDYPLNLKYSVTSSFNSVLNLLSLPDYTFVGVGIKHNLAKLEQQYGIGCMNAVELGPLAASIMNKPRLSYCGVDELAFVVNNLDLRKHRPLSMNYDWGCNPLSIELVKLATVYVYSYYKIGSTLLAWDSSIPPEPSFDE
ncbi:protein RISC-INTERACTING CLEARING 3'-5' EXORIBONUCLEASE 2-like [Vicia villosa]|uniref:protein RISC-INTERACTING CLEARING 3'-5' EXORIBONUCLEASE 2-like n=1 Tax=Vicia villosa TaxID=3911 RepID=UPI00273B6959|nr:protein RISC-INTERACTING CLEARING 3'-5' EXORIBONUCLEASE 2-like [Vicia villosa]